MIRVLGLVSVLLVCASLTAAQAGEFKMPKKPIMVFETNQGTFEAELMPAIAPKACENFIRLAEKGYYDNTIFHRVILKFMIQGGDPEGTGRGGQSIWGKPFKDECRSDVPFDGPGILAMANAGPNTNGSQFFITTVPTPWLTGKHTIFGKIIKGYNVVEKIGTTKTGEYDRPSVEQKILKIRLKK